MSNNKLNGKILYFNESNFLKRIFAICEFSLYSLVLYLCSKKIVCPSFILFNSKRHEAKNENFLDLLFLYRIFNVKFNFNFNRRHYSLSTKAFQKKPIMKGKKRKELEINSFVCFPSSFSHGIIFRVILRNA